MSRSINRHLALVLALGLWLFGITSVAVPSPPATGGKNAFTVTRDILKIFYPEAFGSGRYFNAYTGQPVDDEQWGEFRGLSFTISRFGPGVSWNQTHDASTGKTIPPPANEVVLKGTTWVGNNGELIQFSVSGDLAHSQQNDAIHNLIESHPEWSGEQEIHYLKDAGAKYGPADKQQFMSSLHLDKAEKILGPLRILLIEFNNANSDHVGDFAAGAFQWAVQGEAQLPDGGHAKYAFGFEPLDGRLVSIHHMN